ncbi:unnamed protein product [Nyctereutes procyonoides]|uniref:(raccoon dog) hypothetical protein n=1 Tax=Nyctereutes procyonoides TaxID=34880 RepID=A0A811Y4U5_NYCPR|nr:unnamed protein product [Nyctereutes procyonoides]
MPHNFSEEETCEGCTNLDIDLPNKKLCIKSEHSVNTLLETLGKRGKAISYFTPSNKDLNPWTQDGPKRTGHLSSPDFQTDLGPGSPDQQWEFLQRPSLALLLPSFPAIKLSHFCWGSEDNNI